jgi:hypothetical protein
MQRQFRRSRRWGLLGFPVVVVAVIAVALSMGQNQAHPTGALVIIFAIIGAYLFGLLFMQSRDVGGGTAAEARALAEPAHREIADPTGLGDAELWVAMATEPISDDAIAARRQMWEMTRSSIRTAFAVCVLIFLGVVPIYVAQTFIPLFVFGGLAALLALWKGAAAVGGTLDRAYDLADRAMAPLGLRLAQRVHVSVEFRWTASDGRWQPVTHGAVELRGERHGRAVRVRMPASADRRGGEPASDVEVRTGTPGEFALTVRGGKLRVGDSAPDAVQAAISALHGSPRWKGVRGGLRDGTVSVERRSAGQADWMLDLWLAERVADALG